MLLCFELSCKAALSLAKQHNSAEAACWPCRMPARCGLVLCMTRVFKMLCVVDCMSCCMFWSYRHMNAAACKPAGGRVATHAVATCVIWDVAAAGSPRLPACRPTLLAQLFSCLAIPNLLCPFLRWMPYALQMPATDSHILLFVMTCPSLTCPNVITHPAGLAAAPRRVWAVTRQRDRHTTLLHDA
jgi:hypothetical protein